MHEENRYLRGRPDHLLDAGRLSPTLHIGAEFRRLISHTEIEDLRNRAGVVELSALRHHRGQGLDLSHVQDLLNRTLRL